MIVSEMSYHCCVYKYTLKKTEFVVQLRFALSPFDIKM